MTEEKGIGNRDEVIGGKAFCCEHDGACAVHQRPFDAAYVHCTCGLAAGRGRHERFLPDVRYMKESGTVQ